MISVKVSDIPQWARAGEFYRNLSSDDPDKVIEVPSDSVPQDSNRIQDENSLDDFCKLIKVALFWMLDDIPMGILEFCVRRGAEVRQNVITNVPGVEKSVLLWSLFGEYPLNYKVLFSMVIKTDKLELILLAARLLVDSSEATAVAAEEGNLPVLKYLHEQGFGWNERTCSRASTGGYLDCLQYAHENGCPWDKQTTHKAALAGQLATLSYAMELGCPFGNTLLHLAARSSNFECLRYLLEDQGLGMDKTVFGAALLRGNLQCLQYLLDHGSPYLDAGFFHTAASVQAYDIVFVKNNREFTQCVRYVVERGWKIDATFCKYVSSRDAECTAYLVSEGLFINTVSITHANIPTWLQFGDLYRSLGLDDPEEIVVPANCFVKDNSRTACKNADDFCQLIRTALFWMLDEIPVGVLNYCAQHDAEDWQNAVSSVPGARESKILDTLMGLYPFRGKIPFEDIMQTNKLELILHAARRMRKYAATASAALERNLRVLKYLHEQGLEWDEETCWRASQSGELTCLRYAHENGCPWNRTVYTYAAEKGHLHIMQYAHQQGLNEWHVDVCTYAAYYGQLDSLQYAHEQGCPWDENTPLCAVDNNYPAVLRYAMEEGCPYRDNLVYVAAIAGSIECLRYLVEDQLLPLNEIVFMAALLRGNFPALNYLIDQGCPYLGAALSNIRFDTYDEIFVKDNPEFTQCMQYALERGWEVNATFCEYISTRDAECVAYLRSEGVFVEDHMGEHTLNNAARAGEVATLRSLFRQFCPHDHFLVCCAAESCNVECLQYLVEDQLLDTNSEEVFLIVMLKGNLACLQYIIDLGCPYLDASFYVYVRGCDVVFVKGNPEFTMCVRYAVERGWKVDAAFCEYVSTRDAECTAYLKSEGLFV